MKHLFTDYQKSLLLRFLSDFNTSFPQETLGKLYSYSDMVLNANQGTNLISKNDASKFLSRHITDSLMPFIVLKNNSITFSNKSWADMGSGAGCPVIPLSIVLPEVSFYAVEPRTKRVAFLQEVKRTLNLQNLKVIGKRFETSELYNLDFISCRALSSFENDWERAKNKLKPTGLFITLKSLESITHLKNIKITEYQLPEEPQHYAIVMKGIYD